MSLLTLQRLTTHSLTITAQSQTNWLVAVASLLRHLTCKSSSQRWPVCVCTVSCLHWQRLKHYNDPLHELVHLFHWLHHQFIMYTFYRVVLLSASLLAAKCAPTPTQVQVADADADAVSTLGHASLLPAPFINADLYRLFNLTQEKVETARLEARKSHRNDRIEDPHQPTLNQRLNRRK